MRFLALVILGCSVLFGAVDINTAGKKELISLNGIGEKKVTTILEYRSTHCFKSIDELMKVKGIGKKFIEKNKVNLTASACKVK